MALPSLPAAGADWSAWGAAVHAGVNNAAPMSLARRTGARWVALGDSITAADSYLRYTVTLGGGKVRLVRNAGVGGDQIDQMVARFDTDVTPYAPTMVSVMGGTNDYTFGTTDAQFRSRVQSFVAKVRSIGAVPLLFTSPPCNVLAASDRAKIPRNNVWMADYAAREGILLVDAYAALADTAGYGMYRADLVNGDGIHPNEAGHFAVAQATAAVLNPIMPPLTQLAATNADPTNLLSNGQMVDGNGDGWGDDWGQVWGLDAGTWTYSIVTDAAVPGGQMQRTTLTTATGHVSRNQDVTGGYSAGDVLRLTALVTTTAGTYVDIAMEAIAGSSTFAKQTISQPVTRGLADVTFAIPTGTTTLRVTFSPGAKTAGITGTVDVGAITLRNLTVLGIA